MNEVWTMDRATSTTKLPLFYSINCFRIILNVYEACVPVELTTPTRNSGSNTFLVLKRQRHTIKSYETYGSIILVIFRFLATLAGVLALIFFGFLNIKMYKNLWVSKCIYIAIVIWTLPMRLTMFIYVTQPNFCRITYFGSRWLCVKFSNIWLNLVSYSLVVFFISNEIYISTSKCCIYTYILILFDIKRLWLWQVCRQPFLNSI